MHHHPESATTETVHLSLSHSGNSFELVFGDRVVKQSTCEFLLTFSSMVATDIEAYLSNLSNTCDEVVIPVSSRDNCLSLSLADFARMRTLYGQMMYQLKLQDLLLRNAICSPEMTAFAV